MRFPKFAAAAALIPTLIGCGQPAPATEQTLEVVSKQQAIVNLEGNEAGPLGGWNIMSQTWKDAAGDTSVDLPVLDVDLTLPLDGLSLEWDYFMIHDDDFTGIIGYVVADPRGLLGGKKIDLLNLMPSGGNVTIAGEFSDRPSDPIADFAAFGLDGFAAGESSRTFTGGNEKNDAQWATMEVEGDGVRLRGQTASAAYDLLVTEDWAADFANVRSNHGTAGDPAFGPATSTEIGLTNRLGLNFDTEQWTVNMLWPRSRVQGTIVDLATGNSKSIDGHGYRENSFGRWAFVVDGWDFAIASGENTMQEGERDHLQWTWQTYHLDDKLDFVEVMFYEDGQADPTYLRLDGNKGELGWEHDRWKYDSAVGRCVPTETDVIAANGEYRVTTKINIGDRQVPILSDATWVTNLYAIMEHFPTVDVTITRNGQKVAEGNGIQAGGEISFLREDLGLSGSQRRRLERKAFWAGWPFIDDNLAHEPLAPAHLGPPTGQQPFYFQ